METMINIKTDKEIKEKAQRLARDLGLPLSTVVNAYLKDFIERREVTFSTMKRMTPKLEKIVANARKDYRAGRNISRSLSAPEEVGDYLDSL